jgi:tRNA nucleotidyltransferase (CCA-adding enzyme)
LELIDRLGLYHTVFTDPTQPSVPKPDTTNWRAAYNCLLEWIGTPLYNVLVTTKEDRYLAWLLAALVPWSQIGDIPSTEKKKKMYPGAMLAVREGIKAPAKVCDLVAAAVRNRQQIVELQELAGKDTEESRRRDTFGLAIRRWDGNGLHWKLQVLFALLVEVEQRADAGPDVQSQVLPSWQAFLEHLEELDLWNVTTLKPLVDGTQLATALGVKPGRWMGKALEICLAWQLQNPGKTDSEQAIEEVRRRKEELGIH